MTFQEKFDLALKSGCPWAKRVAAAKKGGHAGGCPWAAKKAAAEKHERSYGRSYSRSYDRSYERAPARW